MDATYLPSTPDEWKRDDPKRHDTPLSRANPTDIAGMLKATADAGWYVDLNGPIHDEWFARVTLAAVPPGMTERPEARAYDKRPEDALRRALDEFEASFTPTPATAGAT